MSVKATDANSGFSKIIWYYKLSSASSYTTATDQTVAVNSSSAGSTSAVTKTKTYSSLTANATYNFYAEIYDVAGNMTRSPSSGTIDVTTIPVADSSSASCSPTYWTNGSVTVTLPTASGYTTVYTTDGTTPTASSTAYNSSSKFTVSSNCTVKYVYKDSSGNLGTAGSTTISNIDKTDPSSCTIAISNVTITSVDFSTTVNDSNSGLGKIVWYYLRPEDSSWQSSSVVYTALNGTTTGTTGSVTKKITISVSKGGPVKAYAVAYDVAGNSLTTTNATSSSPLIVSTGYYTVSYNMNGGTGTIASQSKYQGINITLSTTVPTRTGYQFLGWSTSSSATSATYTAGGTYSANSSCTLYAVWQVLAVSGSIDVSVTHTKSLRKFFYTSC
jgi:uncharacterized repeat protein (TIGR02543 family)